jgi:hypothetical protein
MLSVPYPIVHAPLSATSKARTSESSPLRWCARRRRRGRSDRQRRGLSGCWPGRGEARGRTAAWGVYPVMSRRWSGRTCTGGLIVVRVCVLLARVFARELVDLVVAGQSVRCVASGVCRCGWWCIAFSRWRCSRTPPMRRSCAGWWRVSGGVWLAGGGGGARHRPSEPGVSFGEGLAGLDCAGKPQRHPDPAQAAPCSPRRARAPQAAYVAGHGTDPSVPRSL